MITPGPPSLSILRGSRKRAAGHQLVNRGYEVADDEVVVADHRHARSHEPVGRRDQWGSRPPPG